MLKKNILTNLSKTQKPSFYTNQIKNYFKNNSNNRSNFTNKTPIINNFNKSFNSSAEASNTEKPNIVQITKPTVYIGKSNNIIFNLSTEEFFYEFQNIKKPILFLWQNDTNVVIGKHQNPWKECKITNMNQNNVKLASKF
jgi:lipoate-protein ligase A